MLRRRYHARLFGQALLDRRKLAGRDEVVKLRGFGVGLQAAGAAASSAHAGPAAGTLRMAAAHIAARPQVMDLPNILQHLPWG